MIENRALRCVFGPERDEGKGDRRKLHDEEFYDLHSSPNIIRVIKSRKIRCVCVWAGRETIDLHSSGWW